MAAAAVLHISALIAARDTHTGLPVRIAVQGTHRLDAALVFNGTTAASYIELDGTSGATLQASTAAGGILLSIEAGAPPVRLRGLALDGQLRHTGDAALYVENCSFLATELAAHNRTALYFDGVLEGGRVEVRETRFEGLPAGALHVLGGTVLLWDSVLSSNNATRGAAARVSGGLIAFIRCEIERNTATEAGGALAVSGGLVLLADQTTLRDNVAPNGSLMFLEANASVTYGLPAPLGHWIDDSFVCEKARQPCSGCIKDDQPELEDQPCDWVVRDACIAPIEFSLAGTNQPQTPAPCEGKDKVMPFTLELILGRPATELGLTVTTFDLGAIEGDEERPGSYPVACCSGWQLDPHP